MIFFAPYWTIGFGVSSPRDGVYLQSSVKGIFPSIFCLFSKTLAERWWNPSSWLLCDVRQLFFFFHIAYPSVLLIASYSHRYYVQQKVCKFLVRRMIMFGDSFAFLTWWKRMGLCLWNLDDVDTMWGLMISALLLTKTKSVKEKRSGYEQEPEQLYFFLNSYQSIKQLIRL